MRNRTPLIALASLFTTASLFLSVSLLAADNHSEDKHDGNSQEHESDLRPTGRGNRTRETAHTIPGSVVSGNGINFHNGSVLHTVNLYYIWYGNWPQASKDVLTHFANNIGGSPYFAINTTYGDATANVPNAVTYVASHTDAGTSTALSDANILAIVQNAIASGDLGPADPNGLYMLLTGPGVTATSGFLTQYCGWHDWSAYNGTNIQYAFVGNATGRHLTSCAAQTTSPNGDAAIDGMVSVMAHELEETATDPRGAGWYDAQGDENGDKCAWKFGTTYVAPNGSKANMTLGPVGNQRNYLIQQNWLNAGGGLCVLSYSTSPDFIAGVSSSQTVAPGGTSGNYTVTANPINGFAGTVSWTVNPPLGITVSPATLTGGAASFNLATTAVLSAGTYTIPITATSGTLTHTVNATLVVTAANFSLSITPSSATVTRPASGTAITTFIVRVTAVGAFNSSVNLSVSGAANGFTPSLGAGSAGPGGSSILTVTVSSGARRTTRAVTVSGTSGGITHTASANVTLQ
jgi:hypothetical protein